ncbi:hypothetical protein HELRODRAFT_171985 [Helobdella robusta]|uniref:EGF-like domain-containing protein n=1 Tax=Helobdella robusta TaxID=6412 RepID=T1F4X1_HELRO|nr:hypothetical protein HELRODRAFT_171985 [Helobdella robusta]ESO04978.1 hypothetical protein HELRODRAFT_171985 [Helobdella robusta]
MGGGVVFGRCLQFLLIQILMFHPSETVNLAFKRKVYASSVELDYPPNLASDGVKNVSGKMAKTLDNSKPGWLVIDLEFVFPIKGVNVYITSDDCWCHMNNFEIWLSNTFDVTVNKSITKTTLCARAGVVSQGLEVTLNCLLEDARFRYVILHQASNESQLSVTEIEVIGDESYVQYYAGCFMDFKEAVQTRSVQSLEECFNNRECYCSSVLTSRMLPLIKCEYRCSDEELLSCPKAKNFNIFRVSPCNYKDSSSWNYCPTHCSDEKPADSLGMCSDCQAGYCGSTCQLRDCYNNNGGCGDHQCIIQYSNFVDAFECDCNEGYHKSTYDGQCEHVQRSKRKNQPTNSEKVYDNHNSHRSNNTNNSNSNNNNNFNMRSLSYESPQRDTEYHNYAEIVESTKDNNRGSIFPKKGSPSCLDVLE